MGQGKVAPPRHAHVVASASGLTDEQQKRWWPDQRWAQLAELNEMQQAKHDHLMSLVKFETAWDPDIPGSRRPHEVRHPYSKRRCHCIDCCRMRLAQKEREIQTWLARVPDWRAYHDMLNNELEQLQKDLLYAREAAEAELEEKQEADAIQKERKYGHETTVTTSSTKRAKTGRSPSTEVVVLAS